MLVYIFLLMDAGLYISQVRCWFIYFSGWMLVYIFLLMDVGLFISQVGCWFIYFSGWMLIYKFLFVDIISYTRISYILDVVSLWYCRILCYLKLHMYDCSHKRLITLISVWRA